MTIRYADAGVDLDVAERLTARITERVGGRLFGGFLPVSALKSYEEPVLVSSIDGVGTKVRLALRLERVEGLGRDLVHHCVNDIAVHGASPLLFLDYIAAARLEGAPVEAIVKSVVEACDRLGIRLAGGETAEMPGVYASDGLDLAGAIVGVVEAREIVDGSAIREGDILVGMPSSGLHTNGFSLVQRAMTEEDYRDTLPGTGGTVGDALLEPHRCYLEEIRALLATECVHGMAHITGGGIPGNLSRIIPQGLQAVVDLPSPPPIFAYLEHRGVPRDEMRRVFNMGIGLIAVCDPAILPLHGMEHRVIGELHPLEYTDASRAGNTGNTDSNRRSVRFYDVDTD